MLLRSASDLGVLAPSCQNQPEVMRASASGMIHLSPVSEPTLTCAPTVLSWRMFLSQGTSDELGFQSFFIATRFQAVSPARPFSLPTHRISDCRPHWNSRQSSPSRSLMVFAKRSKS